MRVRDSENDVVERSLWVLKNKLIKSPESSPFLLSFSLTAYIHSCLNFFHFSTDLCSLQVPDTMKSSTTFSLLALAASAASSPLAAPELEDRTFFFPGCSPENKVLIFAGLDQEFCSAYLQPTSTATVVKTALSTAFVCLFHFQNRACQFRNQAS